MPGGVGGAPFRHDGSDRRDPLLAGFAVRSRKRSLATTEAPPPSASGSMFRRIPVKAVVKINQAGWLDRKALFYVLRNTSARNPQGLG